MKVKILDKLDEAAAKADANAFQPLDAARQLLAADLGKERAILGHLGMDAAIKDAEKQQGIKYERELSKEKFGLRVYNIAEIKEICLKYNLRFLQSNFYKGSFDGELAPTLRRFTEEHKINTEFEGRNFFIMAPSSAFNLEAMPVKQVPPKLMPEPTLFYRINNADHTEGTNYVAVHHWGKDFTVLRRVLGWINMTAWSYLMTRVVLAFLGFLLAGQFIAPGIFGILGAVGITIAYTYFFIIWPKCTDSSGDWDSERFAHLGADVNWNSQKEVRGR